MPRRIPTSTAGLVFHVLNRGARRMRLFDDPGDYKSFLALLRRAQDRSSVRCLAYCIMPNHFHLVLWPGADGDLSNFMFWLTTMHARAWQRQRDTRGHGHVYQGRFKALPVCEDSHLLRLSRYVEQNALRAGLVSRAEHWQWSSLAQWVDGNDNVVLTAWPVQRPDDWLHLVNEVRPDETKAIRQAIRRSAPFGPDDWTEEVTARLGLQQTITPVGRPKNKPGVVFAD